MMPAVLTRRPALRDGLLALLVAALATVSALAAPQDGAGFNEFAFLLVLLGAGMVAVRGRYPTLAVGITSVTMMLYELGNYPGQGVTIALLIALYTAVRLGHRLIALLPASVIVAVIVSEAVRDAEPAGHDTALVTGWLVAGAVFGEVSRQRAAYVRQVEERAAEAEHTREETARRRAGEERLRIARELHDSLTHSISVIKVQAGVAVHLSRKRGEEVSPALLAIQEASGDALRELRETLEVLRGTPDRGEDGEEAGASGLERLPGLVARARSTGLPVSLRVTGAARRLPEQTDLAAYRIVQEALTNVSRHSGASLARVEVAYGADELTVRVEDDGRASADAPPVPGTGLLGMRERVTGLGGELRSRPRPEGGFEVAARLPLPVREAETR
jgi:signal transduction histidine kinase